MFTCAACGSGSELVKFANNQTGSRRRRTPQQATLNANDLVRGGVKVFLGCIGLQSFVNAPSLIIVAKHNPQLLGFKCKHGGYGNRRWTPASGHQSSLCCPSRWRGNFLHVVTVVNIHYNLIKLVYLS